MERKDLTFPNRDLEPTLETALELLFRPEITTDTQDGLVMLDILADEGRLTDQDRAGLRERFARRVPAFIPVARHAVWGDREPPQDRFWWTVDLADGTKGKAP